MYYILVVWLYGVTIAVIPVQFSHPSHCEAAGQAFLSRTLPIAKSPGYVCLPINEELK